MQSARDVKDKFWIMYSGIDTCKNDYLNVINIILAQGDRLQGERI